MDNKKKTTNKYTEEFKKTIVTLLNNGKTFSDIEREYGVSYTAASKWKKMFSSVTTDDGEILTMQQIKALQKRNAQLEEENIILKKAGFRFAVRSRLWLGAVMKRKFFSCSLFLMGFIELWISVFVNMGNLMHF